ncbi:MAG: nucleotide-binding universal stress UspA family protein [Methanobacteriota archaeon]|jgi:nucleotide-binding universal stress UspA family protein|uniref:Universal stress protein n=1 Tax=Halorutilus salinus TaxID=2487751 RepID=A0A9Q4C1G7_9EURY|nr:universal stress protein [Halorutilus salinus]MCX2818202.1 universal stress protein [Halorutilus salinus]
MVEHVLVPVDGSPGSKKAFEWALDEFDAQRVTVLHVVHPSDTSRDEGETVDVAKVLMSGAVDVLDGFDAEREGVGIERKLTVGRNEGDAIVRYVKDSDADTVVMGSHGRTGVSRVVLGSVAENVVRRSPVPVVVVR